MPSAMCYHLSLSKDRLWARDEITPLHAGIKSKVRPINRSNVKFPRTNRWIGDGEEWTEQNDNLICFKHLFEIATQKQKTEANGLLFESLIWGIVLSFTFSVYCLPSFSFSPTENDMEINQITMLTAPILVLQSDSMLLGKRGFLKWSSGVYEFTQ